MVAASTVIGLCIIVIWLAVAYAVRAAKQQNMTNTPAAVARARLEREIASIHAKLTEQPDGQDPIALEVWRARQTWWQSELAKTPISALNVESFGPATYETLKRHGFNTVADLHRLGRARIRNFGERKRDALMSAHRRFCSELERRNQNLTWEELDAIAGGNILRLRNEMSARSRAKLRAEEAMRIRLVELQRRRAAIATADRHQDGLS